VPAVDGFDAARAIKQHFPDVPILGGLSLVSLADQIGPSASKIPDKPGSR
jgi:hypothetical protein